jgi:hypothetical protein
VPTLPGHKRASQLAAVLALWGPWASAAEEPKARALLHVDSNPELVERIRGQTSDLPIEVIVTDERAPAEEPLATATRLGRARGATVVVWLSPVRGGGWNVYVADIEHGDLIARRIALPDSADRLAVSAAQEAAALVVRSTLASLSSGDRIGGVPEPTPSPPERAAEEPARVPSVAPAPPDRPERSQREAHDEALGVFLSAGAELGVDTKSTGPWYGPALGAGARLGRWELGARGTYGAPRDLEDSLTRLRIDRYTLGARATHVVPLSSAWALLASVDAGVAAYNRTTTVLEANVEATDGRTSLSPLAGLSVAASFAPASFPLSLHGSMGADVVPRAPTFQYARSGAEIDRGHLWPVQPNATLSVRLTTRRF